VNVASGTADEARKQLEEGGSFEVHAVEPDDVERTVRELVAGGASRILVSGGDGTIATAASVLIETPAELAILPGGTLNHFARDLGIATDPLPALELATSGTSRGVDIGMVNGRVFLNTSSVGAYVRFVRVRERLEKRFGYRLASALAALRVLLQFRRLAVQLEVDGETRIYRTPLVFIGVGERELQLPALGSRIAGGQRGLHVLVVRGRSSARLLAIALASVARGVEAMSRTPHIDSFLVDRCTIDMRRSGLVAIDGEVVMLETPIEYSLRRDALQVVAPEPAAKDGDEPSASSSSVAKAD
jgi:diacylglycerol kinase family enzyme